MLCAAALYNSDSGHRMVLDRFIVLEGLDGAGTTTQLRLAEERLSAEGWLHFCTSEPTGSPLGLLIRDVLKRGRSLHPTTLALLFAADRAEHLREPGGGILPRLERGELVISDRYLFSSLAYQSLDCDFEYVRRLNQDFPLPRHVVFLDTPVPESQRRLAGRAVEELFDGADIQDRILDGYSRAFQLYRDSGLRLHVLDGTLPAGEVFGNFWKIIQSVPML
jgi:dTMP kinase